MFENILLPKIITVISILAALFLFFITVILFLASYIDAVFYTIIKTCRTFICHFIKKEFKLMFKF
ncbi:MAG: hypothetical protein A3F72_13910 [Bacteroidetes bacterium RIFCSPLOWO2_12_FULL_35_15]|nr:MAG: hypothetical protein A3F72_13910 [Bacteroidetes bacterium RIFCSPLOWO2_12_FULL_35_15]